jgi:hypothetical protein
MQKNYAIIKNGKVVNIAISESALDDNWIASEEAQIGWTYENGSFAPPVNQEVLLELTPEELLASERNRMIVSRFQAKEALRQAGLLETIDQFINSSENPVLRLAWSEAIEFRRNSPTILQISEELELTETQIDDLFRLAKTLEI